MMKVCKKCGIEKPIEDFYVQKGMSDGHLSFCKDCVRDRVHKHRLENLERIRKYDRNRPNAKERIKKEREDIKNNKERYKRYTENKRKWDNKNKHKKNAHAKVKSAVDRGLLIKPNACQICGKTNCEIQGHHHDYSKPLDVIWVCTECHGKLHRKYKD